MKRFLFFLRPDGGKRRKRSRIYYNVIVAGTIFQAVSRFSNGHGLDYCGIIKLSEKKYQVFYKIGKDPYKEELMYVVIEKDRDVFAVFQTERI